MQISWKSPSKNVIRLFSQTLLVRCSHAVESRQLLLRLGRAQHHVLGLPLGAVLGLREGKIIMCCNMYQKNANLLYVLICKLISLSSMKNLETLGSFVPLGLLLLLLLLLRLLVLLLGLLLLLLRLLVLLLGLRKGKIMMCSNMYQKHVNVLYVLICKLIVLGSMKNLETLGSFVPLGLLLLLLLLLRLVLLLLLVLGLGLGKSRIIMCSNMYQENIDLLYVLICKLIVLGSMKNLETLGSFVPLGLLLLLLLLLRLVLLLLLVLGLGLGKSRIIMCSNMYHTNVNSLYVLICKLVILGSMKTFQTLGYFFSLGHLPLLIILTATGAGVAGLVVLGVVLGINLDQVHDLFQGWAELEGGMGLRGSGRPKELFLRDSQMICMRSSR